MESITAGQLAGIYQTRYFSFAGVTALMLDHILTFNRETQLVWTLQRGYLKWAFLINRYLVPIVLILFLCTLSGHDDSLSTVVRFVFISPVGCNCVLITGCFVGLVSMSVSNSLILLKVRTLWDGKKNIVAATRAVFLVSQTGVMVAMGFAAFEVLSNHVIAFNPPLGMCIMTKTPASWKGVWAVTILFDLFTFIMVGLNALSRPRGTHTLLMKVLYRDGLFFFLVSLRLLNLVMAVSSDPSRVMLGVCLIWSLVTTLVSRMIMNLRLVEIVTKYSVNEAALALSAFG
ncbi:hypothetical protein JB92DRAFT_2841423 [Gautieria morchelliformis]|nr:hypothetical protein JB92DRAFT_2841423 [Gautieria morchelliformis]